MPLKENTARILKELRLEKGVSQEQLSRCSGIDRTFISGVERKQRNITLDTLERFLVALSVDNDLFLARLIESEKL